MSDLYPVAGRKIYIGGPITLPVGGVVSPTTFASVTYVEVDGWETAGAIGDTSELISTNLINRNRTLKQKGTKNAGSMQNNFARLDTDPGQVAMRMAEASTSNYAIMVELSDMASGGSTNTTLEFLALVMSQTDQGGGANTQGMVSFNLEINTNIVTTAAT